ncbi:hypothetical protein CAC42_2263 [Sphaceloma murrayae]|uniref:Uncharacterized protein n=1 Tax=Sphaceloma murrayae TaxID=2082308 RepID=A0A2K1QIP0_9PEZI|nr:hypothetical protein CAC42_2263 [Sphaceloma murrayae]
MESPATVQWVLNINDSDFEKLKSGYWSAIMNQRWDICAGLTDQNGRIPIIISRSRSGIEHYILHITPRDGHGGPKVQAITRAQTMGTDRVAEEQAKMETVMMCRAYPGCRFIELPKYIPDMNRSEEAYLEHLFGPREE